MAGGEIPTCSSIHSSSSASPSPAISTKGGPRSLFMIPPPIHPEDLDLDAPPVFILLEPYGYFSDRTNATTATGVTKDGQSIKVTFWAAQPPRVSCFTVHCSDRETMASRVVPNMPKILSTEDGLVLLRIPICSKKTCTWNCTLHYDHFVYDAGTKRKLPSLDLIPEPPGRVNPAWGFGLLRCRASNLFVVAILSWAYREEQCQLRLYNSKTETWSIKLMYSPQKLTRSYGCKVIVIGGEHGFMGWVDLCRGILLCDVLVDNCILRHIPLPSPLASSELRGSPFYYRDVIVLGGYIKYFEMTLVTNGWEAVKWRRKDSWKKWKKDCVIKVSEDPAHTQQPHDLHEAETRRQLVLKGCYAGYPALSFQDDDVVYITDKYDTVNRTAVVIAVDLRKQTLKDVADFGSGRPLGYNGIYLGSGISNHLRRTPPTRTNNDVQAGKQHVLGNNVQSQPSSNLMEQDASVEEDVAVVIGGGALTKQNLVNNSSFSLYPLGHGEERIDLGYERSKIRNLTIWEMLCVVIVLLPLSLRLF